jgi:hypothetical protein
VDAGSEGLSEQHVLALAKAECEQRGIPWQEPVSVARHWRRWLVRVPADIRGGNAVVEVSRRTGAVRLRYYDR